MFCLSSFISLHRHRHLLRIPQSCYRLFATLLQNEEQKKVEETAKLPWLFVGVGNPGLKFRGTRHNIGFEMIDALSMTDGIPFSRIFLNAHIGEGTIKGVPVVLAKPQTYANLIGESVAPLMEHYGLPTERIVVMFDDMETRLGKLWLLPHGGHGNHKGLINLIGHLNGNRNFPRMRIGIGSPPVKMNPKAYVLQKFCKEEIEMMNKTIVKGIEVLREVSTMGVDNAIDKVSRPKLSV